MILMLSWPDAHIKSTNVCVYVYILIGEKTSEKKQKQEEGVERPHGGSRRSHHEVTMREQPQGHTQTRESQGETQMQVKGHMAGK